MKTMQCVDADIEQIVKEICDVFDLSTGDIKGTSRGEYLMRARQHIVLELRDLGLNYAEIGKILDRTAVQASNIEKWWPHTI